MITKRSSRVLNDDHKSIKGAKIFLLGMVYKPDVDDLKESPALKIMGLLMDEGAQVDYTIKIPTFLNCRLREDINSAKGG